MEEAVFQMILSGRKKKELSRILTCNEKSSGFGLSLSEKEAEGLLACRQESLKEQRRIEFGEGILPKLIEAFCDSEYLEQDDYADILAQLQEVFYLYKNESEDRLMDDELIAFMREQFDGVCYGSVEYLEETCLERFARAVRAGYDGFVKRQGYGEYESISEEMRWDKELYLLSLRELFWE